MYSRPKNSAGVDPVYRNVQKCMKIYGSCETRRARARVANNCRHTAGQHARNVTLIHFFVEPDFWGHSFCTVYDC